MLDKTLGMNRAAVRVSVELNFDHQTTNRQTFAPSVDGRGMLRSSQDLSENYTGTSGTPGGIPGTTSNIPGYVTPVGSTESEYERKEAIRNYEINETKETIISAPGSIRRMTVAVLVDSAVVPDTQRESLARTVALAAGINPERGDSFVLESIPFSTEIADRMREAEESAAQGEKYALWAQIALLVLVLLGAFYFYRTHVRRKALEKETAELLAASQLQLEVAGVDAYTAELTPEERAKLTQQETIFELAKAKPDEVAQLLRAWLADE
jgi:flagellar M-ring protein FliF